MRGRTPGWVCTSINTAIVCLSRSLRRQSLLQQTDQLIKPNVKPKSVCVKSCNTRENIPINRNIRPLLKLFLPATPEQNSQSTSRMASRDVVNRIANHNQR